ncbi:MAG: hypothetical protein HYV01_13085, partial [Deltaproteobacteria bacterium]|nr:hypothetical protein [Deltaproteobacteria bacterium]
LEDKIVQQAVRTVLECVYEEDFLGFSYGFRPGRGCHNALDALWMGLIQRRVNWVLDCDIRGFFDAIDHEGLMKCLEHRTADRRILRLVRKWLRAGVSEDGEWSRTTVGTPQGAVLTPPTQYITWLSRRTRGVGSRDRVLDGQGIRPNQNFLDHQAQNPLAVFHM